MTPCTRAGTAFQTARIVPSRPIFRISDRNEIWENEGWRRGGVKAQGAKLGSLCQQGLARTEDVNAQSKILTDEINVEINRAREI